MDASDRERICSQVMETFTHYQGRFEGKTLSRENVEMAVELLDLCGALVLQWIPAYDELPVKDGRYIVVSRKCGGGWRVEMLNYNAHAGQWEKGRDVRAWLPKLDPLKAV